MEGHFNGPEFAPFSDAPESDQSLAAKGKSGVGMGGKTQTDLVARRGFAIPANA